MANHEINEEQEAVNKALRMIETSDPVHADVYNALFSVLINNDVFLEKLANKMVQQVMISHVMDSTNPDMVMGADQGPVITQLIEKVQEKVDVLNTNQFQPRGDLTVNPSTLRNKEVGVYRVQSKNPVDSITDGVLIHICPYKNEDVHLHILCNYDASIIKIRCIWYGVDRGWKAIK